MSFYCDPQQDTNDGRLWTDDDIRDLEAALKSDDSIEMAAGYLCRAGTVLEVKRKAIELGFIPGP